MREIQTSTHARRPEGAPFILDSCPWKYGVKRFDDSKLTLPEEVHSAIARGWPVVYILTNDSIAYVGQTTNFISRMGQHATDTERGNEYKRLLNSATVIYNEELNKSALDEYEHQLIQLMQADGVYEIKNGNNGLTDYDYFAKGDYCLMFGDLWESLRGHRLYDGRRLAEHTIEEIEESEVFKYSPYKTLNSEQLEALELIMDAIERGVDRAEPIIVEGDPGTGKTILAVYLLKMLKDDARYADMNIRLLEPMTSLRETLKKTVATVSGLSSDDVIGPYDITKEDFGYRDGEKKCFDILLVDETHRLKRRQNIPNYRQYDDRNEILGLPHEATMLDWVLDQAKLPVLFYDPLQTVGPSGVGADGMRASLGDAVERPIRLESQMRVKGGADYLAYVKDILEGRDPAPRVFDAYEFVLHEDFCDFVESFEATHDAHDLTRFVAGYAWSWDTKKDASAAYDIVIDGIGLRWNCTTNNWVPMGTGSTDEAFKIAREVGCIHTVQGYDLSYAYVIIGEDIRLDAGTGRLVAVRANYYDRNGKASASDEELTEYLKNIYYVLLTRGIYGTHVYAVDPDLRAWLRGYFAQDV